MSSAPGTANEVPADDRDESDTITACAVVLVFLASVAVFLRFYVRVKLLHSVKSEDWCMLASLVFALSASVFLVLEAQTGGLGRPLSTVLPAELMAFSKWALFQGLFYYLSLGFTKISILLLYLRVLTHDYIRKATWAAIGIVAVFNAWALAIHLTMCIPLEKAWDNSIPGYCHGDTGHGDKIFWAMIYLHIITDFMIFVIPIPVVGTMTIPLRQKIGLLFVFTVGLFVCLLSVVRVILLNKLLHTVDFTWDLIPMANWSSAELNMAIVCGCMPTLRPVLSKVFGPLVNCLFPEPHHSLGDASSEQPRTIGSMPLDAFRLGRRSKHQGSGAVAQSSTLWARGETLSMPDFEIEAVRNEVHSKGMDSDAELISESNGAGTGSNDGLREPPRVHARG